MCPWKAANMVGVMPSSSGMFRSFLVASFRRSKYPSIAALWYRVISKKLRFKKIFQSVSLPLHPSSHAGLTRKQIRANTVITVGVSAAQSHKTKAKSGPLLKAAHIYP